MSSVKRGILSLLSSQVLSTVLYFVISIYNTRILGPAGKGEFSIFFNANSLFATFASFSLGHAVIYFSANEKIPIGRLVITIGSFFAFLTLLSFGSLLGLQSLNLSHLVFPENHSTRFDQIIFTFLLFLNLFCNYMTCFLNGRKFFISFSASYVIPALIAAFWYAGIYYLGWQWIGLDAYTIVVFTTVATSVIHLTLTTFFFTKQIGLQQDWTFCNADEIKHILSFVSFVYLTNLIQFLTFKIDLWIVDHYQPKEIVGIYSLAVSLAQLIWIIPQTIGNVLLSFTSSDSESQAITRTMTLGKILFPVMFLLALGMIGGLYFMIPLIYGKDFSHATYIISILMIGVVPYSMYYLFQTYLISRNKHYFNMVATGISLVTVILFDLLLIPAFQETGAAFAAAISYIAGTMVMLYFFLKTTKLPFRSFLGLTEAEKNEWKRMKSVILAKIGK